jgi:periplasmic protein TonB
MIPAIDLLESARARIGRWSVAALIVAVLHAGGGALAFMQWIEEEAAEAVGAITMELAPTPTTKPSDTPEVPPGPEAEEAMQALPASKRAVEDVEKEIPKVEQSPAPDPQVVLPTPMPEEKKTEEKENREEIQQQPTPVNTENSPVTSAPPKVEAAAPAAVTAAPSPGTANEAAKTFASWTKLVIAHLNLHKRYPTQAQARGERGSVGLQFTLDRSGHVLDPSIQKSSGSRLLDEEALALLKRASPLPAPPSETAGLPLTVPINFNIK